ncbi:uncharacterized protein AB675_5797 [Cyphellophora attinorum]|uniref:DUF7908 domain-containing protein n=1 Tax=Cyphellophora attinorum TaxID=1664694 RepID=A0A0N1NY90_9EURO|nr:uncharacterized protein AB675_5797 [Phialophora attinorum]KPI38912.1 hypothetical protein AB675_5797 [Phialophora attinorum]
MAPKKSLIWSSIAAFLLGTASAQAPAVTTVKVDAAGSTCPPDVTVAVVTGVYNTYISASTLYSFYIPGNGNAIVINNGPTYYQTTYVVTTTATVTASPTGGNTINPGQQSTTGTSPVATGSGSTTQGPAASTTTPPIQSTVPPPSTVTTASSIVAVVTNSDGSVSTTTLAPEPDLSIGQNFPPGTVAAIPSESPALIAVAIPGLSNKKRQEAGSGSKALGYAGAPEGATADSCAYAKRYFIQDGLMTELNSGGQVNRNVSQDFVQFEPSFDSNTAISSFKFVDGVLSWDTPIEDGGSANFYQCGDSKVYAGWPSPRLPDCYSVVLGAVGASSCPYDFSAREEPALPPPDVSSSTTDEATVSTTDVPPSSSADQPTSQVITTEVTTEVTVTQSDGGTTIVTTVTDVTITPRHLLPLRQTRQSIL